MRSLKRQSGQCSSNGARLGARIWFPNHRMVIHAANIIFRNLLKYRCCQPDRLAIPTPIEPLAYAKIRKRPITVRYNLLLDMFYGWLGERLRPASLVRYARSLHGHLLTSFWTCGWRCVIDLVAYFRIESIASHT